MRNLETSLSLDELIAEATKRYRDLLNSERKTVANYWEFGRVLKSLRPKHVGDWMAFLDKQGWSYSRVKRRGANPQQVRQCKGLPRPHAQGRT